MAGRMLDKIKQNRELFLSGKLRCIPFRNAPRLTSYFPGIIKGSFDAVTGNSSTGKTTIAKQLYVVNAISFAIEYNLDLKILYFALEESEEQFDYTLYSSLAYSQSGARLNIRDFESFTSPIDEKHINILETSNTDDVFEQYKSYIHVYDSTYNSFGIYDAIRNFAASRGVFYMNDVVVDMQKGHTHWNKYVPNNPDEFVIVVVDHLGEMHPDAKENTVFNAMDNMTRYLRHYVTKRFNYNALAIHQQAAAQEDLEHKKENFTRASLNGLGDFKLAGRRYMNVLGINDPSRYGYTVYPNENGYNVNMLSGYFRTINIAKQRYGPVNKEIGIFFDGKTGYIKELPLPDDTANMIRVYEKIREYDSTT